MAWAEEPQLSASVLQAVGGELGELFPSGHITLQTAGLCRVALKHLHVERAQRPLSDPEQVFATSLLDLAREVHQEKTEDPRFDLQAAIRRPVGGFNQFGVEFYSPYEKSARIRYDLIQRMVAGSDIGAALSAFGAAVTVEPSFQKLAPKQALGVLKVLQAGILGRDRRGGAGII